MLKCLQTLNNYFIKMDENPLVMSISKENPMPSKIKELRTAHKLSMESFGKRIGVSTSAVSLFESGRNNPKVDTLNRIAKEFNVDLNWLLGQSDKAPYDAHAYALLSDLTIIELPHVSFKARASFNYAQLQRFKESDIFDTVLHRLPPGKTAEDYKDALVFDIEGDSMEPSLVNGQRVIAWPISEAKWEQLYNVTCVVAYDDTVTVKRITDNELFTHNRLTLRATGNGGGSFAVARASIQSIYEVREFYGPQPYRYFL
jgi:transcriptional regulator with XRE-family HTH domain